MYFEDDDDYFCDKCGNPPKHWISSANGEPTLKLCDKCYAEFTEYIRQKKNDFLGKELFKKGE